jgi:hypothetical protein
LQIILNALPAIPIVGNNLKFQFGGDNWVATVNGENFWAGTSELEDTDDGAMLTLQQTHIWPGAVGKTAGRLAKKVPGGGAVGGALDTAGSVAGAVGPIEVSGSAIVLQYKAGPPAKLSYLRRITEDSSAPPPRPETALATDKLNVAINASPAGLLLYGPSVCLELSKANFNFEFNLIMPIGLGSGFSGFSGGIGGLVTFNRFWHRWNGGFYLGGGIGYIFTKDYYHYTNRTWDWYGVEEHYEERQANSHLVINGLNLGYKFVLSSGLYFRTGALIGFGVDYGYVGSNSTPLSFYAKPDLTIGYVF